MMLAFDLDGTLIETWPAHLAAYREVGVEPPLTAQFEPAREWLKDESAHEAKKKSFLRHLRMLSRPLPAMRIFQNCGGVVLTGASESSVRDMQLIYPSLRGASIIPGMDTAQKLIWMRDAKPGVYFDDSPKVVEIVRDGTDWEAVCVRGF